MDESPTLLAEIENFLNASGVKPTAFGREAAADPNFVHALRKGRSPTEKTIRRVRAYIRNHATETVERLAPYAAGASDSS